MKIYLAGSSLEGARVAAALTGIREAGHVVTHDWLAAVSARGSANSGLTNYERAQYAMQDLQEGVDQCDVFWLLLPLQETRGAWVELGYALKRATVTNVRVITSGPGRDASIFTALAHAHFETDEQAAASLQGKAWE